MSALHFFLFCWNFFKRLWTEALSVLRFVSPKPMKTFYQLPPGIAAFDTELMKDWIHTKTTRTIHTVSIALANKPTSSHVPPTTWKHRRSIHLPICLTKLPRGNLCCFKRIWQTNLTLTRLASSRLKNAHNVQGVHCESIRCH